MDVVFYSLLIFALLVVNIVSMRNFHIPHPYFHAIQHRDYPLDDSSSSEGVILRAHRRHNRHSSSDCSASEHQYNCKCSCQKCKKKPKKSCCRDFCATHCPGQSNILVVPYPVPFMLQTGPGNNTDTGMLLREAPPDRINITHETVTATTEATTVAITAETTTTTIATTETTTVTTSQPSSFSTTTKRVLTTPVTRRTLDSLRYTLAPQSLKKYYSNGAGYKRFRILPDKGSRRIYQSNQRPAKFEELPKYGIVPIPENLAMNLMHQIRNDQRREEFMRRRSAGRNYLKK
ncbi:uncharacterized protein LOC113502033 isoform X2 [Trichoplusia ni]|uniref:Uncharacterized protein LOC113502033 isoform X2 n=1 Tax=Trichoplusia ni TaxID=7111 RepID=A0A7E5WES1_TRINI|nr:uncharacterized protein LOC113502033 isoform X2 [Trichoplusia ni]